jgi:predicted secreted protein
MATKKFQLVNIFSTVLLSLSFRIIPEEQESTLTTGAKAIKIFMRYLRMVYRKTVIIMMVMNLEVSSYHMDQKF